MRRNVTFTCSRKGTRRLWDRVSMAGQQEVHVLFWKIYVTPNWLTKFPTWRFNTCTRLRKGARYSYCWIMIIKPDAETSHGGVSKEIAALGCMEFQCITRQANFHFLSWAEVAKEGVLCNRLLLDMVSHYTHCCNLWFSIQLRPLLWFTYVVGLTNHDVLFRNLDWR
jgi:hypothetical protein